MSATMRGKRTSDDLAKSIYRFKDANPDYANSAIARIFSIPESTLRNPEATYWAEKVKLGRKSVLTGRIKRQLLGRINRNSKLRLSDLLLTARRLVSNATSHRFLKNRDIQIVLLYKTFLRLLKKIGELTGVVDIYFLTSQKVFSATINSSLTNFLKRSLTYIPLSRINAVQFVFCIHSTQTTGRVCCILTRRRKMNKQNMKTRNAQF